MLLGTDRGDPNVVCLMFDNVYILLSMKYDIN